MSLSFFTKVKFSRVVAAGSAIAGYGVAAYIGASPLEQLVAGLAVPGTILVAATAGKLVKKLSGQADAEVNSAADIGDVETVVATLAGLAYASKFANSPAEFAAEAMAIPGVLMLSKTIAKGGEPAVAAPAQARRDRNRM